MIKFNFVPNRIKEAASNIRKEHKTICKDESNISNEEIKNFIEEVCRVSKKALKGYAQLLSDRKINILSVYITQNYFNVDLYNIKFILNTRMNSEIFINIYKNWQNAYHGHKIPECEELLLYTVYNYRYEIEYIDKHDLTLCLDKWLKSDKIDEEVCKTLQEYCRVNRYTNIFDAIEYYDLSDSVLATEASKWYYCYCNGDELLSMTDEQLRREIDGYRDEYLKKFLFNFIYQLRVNDLFRKYKRIWEKAKAKIGEPGTKSYNEFFSIAVDNVDIVKNKYNQWYLFNQMYRIFGDDERSQFWQGKVLDYDVTYFKYKRSTETLIMLFDNYYIIEFRDIGPIYIFSKGYYERNIERLFNVYSSNDVKSILYNRYENIEGFENRFTHHGNWKSLISYRLKQLLKR